MQWEVAAGTRRRYEWLCFCYRRSRSLERAGMGFLLLRNTACPGCATPRNVPFWRLRNTMLIQWGMHTDNMLLHCMSSTSWESTQVTEPKHEQTTPVDDVPLFDFDNSGRGR